MLWLNLCEVWLESCNAPRRPQLRIPAVQESVQSLVDQGTKWDPTDAIQTVPQM